MKKKEKNKSIIIAAMVIIVSILLTIESPVMYSIKNVYRPQDILTFVEPVYVLAEPAYVVKTNIGIVNLPTGTKLGGNPPEYILLEESKEFITTAGRKTIHTGAKIDCDHEPGYPDPCDPL